MRIPVDYLGNVPGDMEKIDGKKRDVKKVKALVKALGRAESNMTSKKSLQKDIEAFSEDIDTIGTDTITEYLDSFYCIETLKIINLQSTVFSFV